MKHKNSLFNLKLVKYDTKFNNSIKAQGARTFRMKGGNRK